MAAAAARGAVGGGGAGCLVSSSSPRPSPSARHLAWPLSSASPSSSPPSSSYAAAAAPATTTTATSRSNLWQRWCHERRRRRRLAAAAASAAALGGGGGGDGEGGSNSGSRAVEQQQQFQQQQLQQQQFQQQQASWRPPQQQQQPWGAPPPPRPDDSSSGGGALSSGDALDATLAEPNPHHPHPHHTGCPVYVMLPLDTVVVVSGGGGGGGDGSGSANGDDGNANGGTFSSSSSSRAVLKRERALSVALGLLAQAGVAGVMVDVWWSACERQGPRRYDWAAYGRLFRMAARAGLRVQAVMSFHAAGGNVGDTCTIPLPRWVEAVGERDPDVFYTDRAGRRNRECLSLGCDELPLFWGRTPVEMYRDFVSAFADEFQGMFGTVITEVTVGLGPAGELRYPAYPEGDGRWRFPGVGEWQCYDRYMLASLREAARKAGRPEWGHGGPHDAGHYNARVWETGFFASEGGSWDSDYGRFFLSWYSGELVAHAERVLSACGAALAAPGRPRVLRRVSRHRAAAAAAASAAAAGFEGGATAAGAGAAAAPASSPQQQQQQQQQQPSSTLLLQQSPPSPSQYQSQHPHAHPSLPTTYEFAPAVALGAKLAGVHWWFKSRSHAAELTAGYYNARGRDGYAPLMRALASVGARCSFTCVEMRDCEHPPEGRCSPQGLLRQVLCCAERHGVPLSGENALQRYDADAFDRIAESAFGRAGRAGRLEQLTFLRMGDLMFDNWPSFTAFVRRMRGLG